MPQRPVSTTPPSLNALANPAPHVDLPPVIAPLATVEEDHARLPPWCRAFDATFPRKVTLNAMDDGSSPGLSLTFPPLFDLGTIGGTGHFRHRPLMGEYMRRIGFGWELAEPYRAITVPSPGTFNQRLATFGQPDAGFRVAYARTASPPLGEWLLAYMQGVIIVNVHQPNYYRRMLWAFWHQRKRRERELTSVMHDISLHVPNYQLIPREGIVDVGRRIADGVPERVRMWSEPGCVTPLTLTFFYDNDFNRYAYAVWCRCERPEDFAGIFLAPSNYRQLLAALEVRLDETRRGRGDIASGEFNEVGKLQETNFDVR